MYVSLSVVYDGKHKYIKTVPGEPNLLPRFPRLFLRIFDLETGSTEGLWISRLISKYSVWHPKCLC